MKVNYLKKAKPVLEADVKALRQGVEEIIDRVRKDGDYRARLLDSDRGRNGEFSLITGRISDFGRVRLGRSTQDHRGS